MKENLTLFDNWRANCRLNPFQVPSFTSSSEAMHHERKRLEAELSNPTPEHAMCILNVIVYDKMVMKD